MAYKKKVTILQNGNIVLKGIVSWDFDGKFLRVYRIPGSLDVRQLCLKVHHVWQKSNRGRSVKKKCAIYPKCAMFLGQILQPNQGYNLGWKNHIWYNFNMKTSKLKKRMSSGSCFNISTIR
jgi:hypothetical protein